MGTHDFEGKGRHGFYLLAGVFYISGWIIALAGVSGAQRSCAEHESEFLEVAIESGLFAPAVGSDCHRLYRFAWFVLFLGPLPLIADLLALGTSLDRGASGASRSSLGRAETWWAVLAVLDILMANVFYNAVDSGKAASTASAVLPIAGGTGFSNSSRERLRCALAGFAIAAAAALVLMWLAPYLIDAADAARERDEAAVATTAQSKTVVRNVVPPAAPVATQAAGTDHPPQVVVS